MDAAELLAQLAEERARLEAQIEQMAQDNEETGSGDLFPIPLVGVTKAEVTVNNGTNDVTVRVMRYRPKEPKDLHKKRPPKWFWVDLRDFGTQYGYSKVAVIHCDYQDPAEADRIDEDDSTDETPSPGAEKVLAVPFQIPSYRFELRNSPDRITDRAAIYAAHLVFLRLTGVNISQEKWTDATGVEREPTDRYEFQRVIACMRCGRKLVKPSSIDDGFGPVCSAKLKKKYDTKTLKWKRP